MPLPVELTITCPLLKDPVSRNVPADVTVNLLPATEEFNAGLTVIEAPFRVTSITCAVSHV